MDRGACHATVYRVTKSRTQLSTHTTTTKVFQILFRVVLEKILASSWITVYSMCSKGWTKQCPLRIELGLKGWTIFNRPRTRTAHCCRGGGVHVWVLDSNAGAGRKVRLAGSSWTHSYGSASCSVVSDCCDPMDCTVHGILQARILGWVAFPLSRGSSQPRDWTQVSHIAGGFFTSWATREVALLSAVVKYLMFLVCPVSTGGCLCHSWNSWPL